MEAPKGQLGSGESAGECAAVAIHPMCVCVIQVAALMMSFSSQPVHCVLSVCSAAAAAAEL